MVHAQVSGVSGAEQHGCHSKHDALVDYHIALAQGEVKVLERIKFHTDSVLGMNLP